MKRIITASGLIIMLISFASPLFCQTGNQTEIKSIRVEKGTDALKVYIEAPQGIPFEHFMLMNPNRFIIDFANTRISTPFEPMTVDAMGVKSIRTGEPQAGTLRIVVDCTDAFPLFSIDETGSGLTLVFRLEEEKETAEEPETVAPPVEKVTTPPKEKPVLVKEKPAVKAQQVSESTSMPYQTAEQEPQNHRRSNTLGLSSGVYFTRDENLKSLYGKRSTYFGAEYSFVLPIRPINALDVWFGFTTFSNTGKTTLFEEELKLTITDFSLALRYVATFGRFMPFAGFGLDYIIFKEAYPSSFPIESIEGTDVGAHFQIGTYVRIFDFLAAKLHFKYVNAKTTKEGVGIDLGGNEYGMGLVFRFNL